MNSESNGGETITSNESAGGEKPKPPKIIINKDNQEGPHSITQNTEHRTHSNKKKETTNRRNGKKSIHQPKEEVTKYIQRIETCHSNYEQ